VKIIAKPGHDLTVLTFNHEGRLEGEVKEFKMTLQCREMKIDGVTREKIEGKKLRELIDKAAPVDEGTDLPLSASKMISGNGKKQLL